MDSGKVEELGYGMIIGRDLLHALKVVIDENANLVKVVKNIVGTHLSIDMKKPLNYYYNLKIYLMVPTV